MLPYVDDLSITLALDSHRGPIRRLQLMFTVIAKMGKDLSVSFSVPKTELIHWRTPSQRTPHRTTPIKLDGHLFHPSQVVTWPGYWLSPALTSTHHFRHRLSLSKDTLILRQASILPWWWHQTLPLPPHPQGSPSTHSPLQSRSLHPELTACRSMNTLWHRVQRWTTNTFFSTPTPILSQEACLPPIMSYCTYSKRLAALRVTWFPLRTTQPPQGSLCLCPLFRPPELTTRLDTSPKSSHHSTSHSTDRLPSRPPLVESTYLLMPCATSPAPSSKALLGSLLSFMPPSPQGVTSPPSSSGHVPTTPYAPGLRI